METLEYKAEISKTFSEVRTFSYDEKKSPLLDEESVNSYLDAILDAKRKISQKTEKICSLTERIEKLTWFNNLDEESLMLLNDLISATKDAHSSLIRQYVSLNNTLKKKGIAREEIRDFKNSIDDIKESYEDLESTFFFLPKMPEFVETTKQLTLVS